MTTRMKLHDAIMFATERHAGQKRKKTEFDYICHPMEVLQILTEMNPEDDDLLIAGILHDVVEDKRATKEEVLERFGPRVANLVAAHTHSKEGTWRERKHHAIDEIAAAEMDVKKIVLADKVSNLRSIYADYQALGDELWERFNAGKEDQRWYYSNVLDVFEPLQYDDDTRDAYWEATELFKDIFVRYFIDAKAGKIWQVCGDEAWVFEKYRVTWVESDEPVSEDAVEESRLVAETLEDHWTEAAIIG